jgi:hypothetical protein
MRGGLTSFAGGLTLSLSIKWRGDLGSGRRAWRGEVVGASRWDLGSGRPGWGGYRQKSSGRSSMGWPWGVRVAAWVQAVR